MPLVDDLSQGDVGGLLGAGGHDGGGLVPAELGRRLELCAQPGDAVGVGGAGHHLDELAVALLDDLEGEGLVLGLGVEGELVGGLA